MKLSLLFLTYNRPVLAKEILLKNLETIGLDKSEYELLICDQGSEDRTFVAWLESLTASYVRLNKYNEGISRSLNQLILRAKAPNMMYMADDVAMPENWGRELLKYIDHIPKTGIVGFEMGELKLPYSEMNGLPLCHNPNRDDIYHDKVQVYGNIVFTKQLIDTIGGFCEEYHPYGLEDADFCFRAILNNFLVYYIPGLRAVHLGLNSDAKVKSYFSNVGHHRWRVCNYTRIGTFERLPILKECLV